MSSWLLRLEPSDHDVLARSTLSPLWIDRISESIGTGPAGWAIELGQRMAAQMVAHVPELGADGIVRELRRGCEGSACGALAVAAGMPATPIEELPGLLAGPEELVSRGLGVHHMLRSFQIGHAVAVDALLAAVEQHLPAAERYPEARELTRMLAAFVDRLTEQIGREFEAVQAAFMAGSIAVRSQLVNDVLSGQPLPPEQARRTLGYDLDGCHAGVVAWADDQADVSSAQLLDLVRTLLRDSGLTSSLVLPVGQRRVWAWGGRRTDPVEIRRNPAIEVAGVGIAVGGTMPGLEGFRTTHRQALEAARVAMAARDCRPLCHYRDVDLLSMMTGDAALAWDFVASELGGLADDDEMSAVYRQTLRQYLDSDRSLQKTAELLHVARSTVAHRVSRAEELRGRPVSERRMQLEAALSLYVDFPGLLAGP